MGHVPTPNPLVLHLVDFSNSSSTNSLSLGLPSFLSKEVKTDSLTGPALPLPRRWNAWIWNKTILSIKTSMAPSPRYLPLTFDSNSFLLVKVQPKQHLLQDALSGSFYLHELTGKAHAPNTEAMCLPTGYQRGWLSASYLTWAMGSTQTSSSPCTQLKRNRKIVHIQYLGKKVIVMFLRPVNGFVNTDDTKKPQFIAFIHTTKFPHVTHCNLLFFIILNYYVVALGKITSILQ